MNPISLNIRNRRSTKPEEFNGDTISNDLILHLLENAIWAPTHGRTEPWQFYVYSGVSLRIFGNQLASAYKSGVEESMIDVHQLQKYQERPGLASHIIGVAMIRGENVKIPAHEELLACACAVQNILLTATSMNIASYWSTGPLINTENFKNNFNLRSEDHFLGLIYLGKINDSITKEGKRNHTSSDKTIFF